MWSVQATCIGETKLCDVFVPVWFTVAGCVRLCRVAGITLCDPIRQVTLRSCEMEFLLTAIHYLYLYLYCECLVGAGTSLVHRARSMLERDRHGAGGGGRTVGVVRR